MYTQDELLYLRCKEKYYNGEQSELSDPEFDALEVKLKSEGSKVPYIVGTKKLISKEEKHNHPNPMLSLEKLQVVDDNNLLEEPEFFKRLLTWMKKSAEIEFTPKYDGNALNCIYRNGVLDKVVTRGDGEKGVDKTNKMKYIVPNTISDKSPVVEVRGEGLIPLSTFVEKYAVEGEIKNARNVLAGLLGTDDLPMEKILDIVFAAYSYTKTSSSGKLEFAHNTMMDLHMMGFNKEYSVKTAYLQTTGKTDEQLIEEFTKIYQDFKSYRKNESEFLLDGIVLKYQESERYKAGETSHHPRWAMSVKFETEKVKTKILDIEWTVGTTGEINPVAILEPIELLGTMVKKASLYNLGKIVENGTWPGAEVLIRKSGEIIPQVVTVLKRSENEDLYMQQYNKMREVLS